MTTHAIEKPIRFEAQDRAGKLIAVFTVSHEPGCAQPWVVSDCFDPVQHKKISRHDLIVDATKAASTEARKCMERGNGS